MLTRQPFTQCKLYVDGLVGVQPGDYITTSGGSAYLVQEVRPSRARPARRNLVCLRWPIAEIPDGARRFVLTWYPRARKARNPRVIPTR